MITLHPLDSTNFTLWSLFSLPVAIPIFSQSFCPFLSMNGNWHSVKCMLMQHHWPDHPFGGFYIIYNCISTFFIIFIHLHQVENSILRLWVAHIAFFFKVVTLIRFITLKRLDWLDVIYPMTFFISNIFSF